MAPTIIIRNEVGDTGSMIRNGHGDTGWSMIRNGHGDTRVVNGAQCSS